MFNLVFVTAGTRIGTGDFGMGDNRMFVSLEQIREDQPQSRFDLERIHKAHKFLNANVANGHRAMLVGEAQVFDLEVPILYNTCFDDCVFESMMRDRTYQQRLAALRAAKVSHIFVFWRELDRYRSPGNYGYSKYATRDLIRRRLVDEQNLLREVRFDPDTPADSSQLFEVVGWDQ